MCTPNPVFYTHAGYSKDAYRELVANSEALRAKGMPHQKLWIPNEAQPNLYLVNEPGDNKFDSGNVSRGVCTDAHVQYGVTGCTSEVVAQVTTALVNCPRRVRRTSALFCGITIVHGDSDFVSDVGIDVRSLVYPRTLVEEQQINGRTTRRVTCWNPLDCLKKCEYYHTHARDGGLPVRACTLLVFSNQPSRRCPRSNPHPKTL